MKIKSEFLNEIKKRGFIYQSSDIEELVPDFVSNCVLTCNRFVDIKNISETQVGFNQLGLDCQENIFTVQYFFFFN